MNRKCWLIREERKRKKEIEKEGQKEEDNTLGRADEQICGCKIVKYSNTKTVYKLKILFTVIVLTTKSS